MRSIIIRNKLMRIARFSPLLVASLAIALLAGLPVASVAWNLLLGGTSETWQHLAQTVLAIVTRHDPGFDGATIAMRASSGGTYVSLTCTVLATSKPQLDALYSELSAHPLVKFVL